MAIKKDSPLQWILRNIEDAGRGSAFCSSGNLPAIDPGLIVAGVGPVAIPLKPKQAKQLLDAGRIAPFGKGTKTLTDAKVRRTTELDASQIQLSDQWNEAIAELVTQVAVELGLEADRLRAKLYKLLLYETGGHFQRHRDSEKKNGMVASLIVMLPTEFHGGELVIRHEGKRESFSFDAARAKESPCYVAFYADCEHEVTRVQRGRRICLAYNLVLQKPKRNTQDSQPSSQSETLATSISNYVRQQPREPLAFALEHQYSQKGLKQELLKGADRGLAELVVSAAESAGCRVFLAQIERHLNQYADDGSSWGRYDRWSPRRTSHAELTLGEVNEDDLSASQWRDLKGKPQPLGAVPLANSSIVSRIPLDEWKPTSEEYEGYTGNAGNTLDRWYHRSALVIWHDDHHFDIVARGGYQASIELFNSMRSKLAKTAKKNLDRAERDCLRLAEAILRQWPSRLVYSQHYNGGDDDQSRLRGFIDTLGEIAELSLVRDVISVMTLRDKQTRLEKFLSLATKRFGLKDLEPSLIQLLSSPMNQRDLGVAPREFGWLLRISKVVKASDKEAFQKLCSLASTRFIESYLTSRSNRTEMKVVSEALEQLVLALVTADCEVALAELIAAVCQRADRFRIHVEQAQCLQSTVSWCQKAKLSIPAPVASWLENVRDQLRVRTQERPSPPGNWERTTRVNCNCKFCAALNQFLADPNLETTAIAAAEHQRGHIESEARKSQIDASSKLEKRGSPHRLVFTKTQDSYERAVKQFEADANVLIELEALSNVAVG